MIYYQAKVYLDGKRYSVEFPDLSGCFSEGATKEEALEHARESLSLYLEDFRDSVEDLPKARSRRGKQYHWVTPYEDVAMALMIRRARQECHLSQRALAKRLGIKVQQLQRLETPRHSNPTVKTLAALTKALEKRLEIQLLST